ncbi:MAG TPA: bifunctional uridylyltransferase/uridylyl-removing protein, partial [Stellaceae bacterium]|nr:bifunctional uridylyltransferase/uridylyl-removing protein [Stellaceae bacterium]
SAEEFESFISKGHPSYWLSFDPITEARHARLTREAARSGARLTLDTRVDTARAVTEMTLYTADHPGLFSKIAGALALAGANIVDAKILTMADGMALDTFWVQDQKGAAFEQPEKISRLARLIEEVLADRVKPQLEFAQRPPLTARYQAFPVVPRVLIDNRASGTHTVIEVNGADRPGLLFALTQVLAALHVQISTAKISTYGEKVVDVFYVKDMFGHKLERERMLGAIREKLLTVLADTDTPSVAAQ